MISLIWIASACAHKAFRERNNVSGNLEHATIFLGKTQRDFLYHKPVSPHVGSPALLPVLIAFHGGGGQASGMETLTGFVKIADDRNFLIVYPEGVNKNWNDGRPEVNTSVDDVAFIKVLISELVAKYHADPARIFVTGISNGGLFSFRLACDLPNLISGAAAVAANLGLQLSLACHPARSVPILNIEGDGDPLMPFDGGQIKGPFGIKERGAVLSSEDTLNFWLEKFRCKKEANKQMSTKQDASTQTTMTEEQYSDCAEHGARFFRIRIQGGGHTWPGGPQYMKERWIGKTTHALSASSRIVEFFGL